ncbi:hypothetical protein IID10_21530, partial [candidate division KSB1 bacterium]|nr:hypothetical protein [candidate division KSB1 bacterium]
MTLEAFDLEKYYGLHQPHLDTRFVLKGTTATYAPDRTFDTEHIRLELKLDLNRQMLRGRCKTTIRALTSQARVMIFDAVNF